MTFNDYVINLNSQFEKLKELGMLRKQLQVVLNLHQSWVSSTFSITYKGLISSTRMSGAGGIEANGLIKTTKDHFSSVRENLIAIDFLEFGEILSNFNNATPETLKDRSCKIVKEYKDNYTIIHSYKTRLDDAYRINEYTNCINSIKAMNDIYDKFTFMVEYINDINKQLSFGSEDEGLEISLLNDRFEKETYSKVTDPIYLIYEKICEIGNIDLKEEPLQIIRMETGSFFIKFIGNKSILKLISSILESFHKIIIRNYTREGKNKI